MHLVGERVTNGDRRLGVMCPVVPVLEPQAVPVHGCLEVALVRDMDSHGRTFGNLERRPGNRAVVGEHSHVCVTDSLDDRPDVKFGRVAIGELDDTGGNRTRQVRWFGSGSRCAGTRPSSVLARSSKSRSSASSCDFGFDPTMRGREIVRVGGDSFRDELGVVLDPTDQRRASSVLPGQPQEEQTGTVGDTASMDHAPRHRRRREGRSSRTRCGSPSPIRRRRRRADSHPRRSLACSDAPTTRD